MGKVQNLDPPIISISRFPSPRQICADNGKDCFDTAVDVLNWREKIDPVLQSYSGSLPISNVDAIKKNQGDKKALWSRSFWSKVFRHITTLHVGRSLLCVQCCRNEAYLEKYSNLPKLMNSWKLCKQKQHKCFDSKRTEVSCMHIVNMRETKIQHLLIKFRHTMTSYDWYIRVMCRFYEPSHLCPSTIRTPTSSNHFSKPMHYDWSIS